MTGNNDMFSDFFGHAFGASLLPDMVVERKLYLTLQEACEGAKKETSIGVFPPGSVINGRIKGTMKNADVCVEVPPDTQTGDILSFAFNNPEDAEMLLPEGTKFIAEIVQYPYQTNSPPPLDYFPTANLTKHLWYESITISPEEARVGCKKKIQFFIPITCIQCNGRGYLQAHKQPCTTCSGSGFMRGKKVQTCKIKIPPMTTEQRGMGIHIKGKGVYLPGGGRGDLFVTIDF